MMARRLCLATGFLLLNLPLFAQGVKLGEKVKPGECFKYELSLKLDGTMTVDRDGQSQPLSMKGEAQHLFTDRIEAADSNGAAGKVVRYYETAKATSVVGGEGSQRKLNEERRLTVVTRTENETLHICPSGPFTRDDLELLGEHFDTLALPSLLPNRDIKVGDTWSVADDAVQQSCQFDGLVKHTLQGRLDEVKDGVALFSISGTAEGIELGAVARVTVEAHGKFDPAISRITALTWIQADKRELGPATPATDVKATVQIVRTVLKDEPKELNADARANVPTDKIPEKLKQLRHVDADQKFQLLYARSWSIIGRASTHTVLRYMEKGEFGAQATITVWNPAAKGQHSPLKEYVEAIAKTKGWEPSDVLDDREMTGTAGRWLHRYSVKGKRDGALVVQTFYFLAGADGQQLLITFLSSPEKATKLLTVEKELLEGLSFDVAK